MSGLQVKGLQKKLREEIYNIKHIKTSLVVSNVVPVLSEFAICPSLHQNK